MNILVHEDNLIHQAMYERLKKSLDSFLSVSYFVTAFSHYEEYETMSTLPGHFEYAIPSAGTFSLVNDRGIDYSASVQRKGRLLDEMRHALRSRHYCSRNWQTKLKRCKKILGVIEDQEWQVSQTTTWEEQLYELTGIDPRICPCCKKGRMVRKEVLRPGSHAPP